MALRVGVVGVGFGASTHVPAFQAEGVDVVAVCARHRDRAEAAARQHGVPVACDSFDDLLAIDGLDAVSITTRAEGHEAMSIAALAAGKHVLCEKPFSTDAASAATMLHAAEASGLTAMVAHEFRYGSARLRARELIDEGYLGRLRVALARIVTDMRPAVEPSPSGVADLVPERDRASLGGGLLNAIGWHYVDTLRHWFGDVERVTATLTTDQPERLEDGRVVLADADDTFSFTLGFAGGGIAQMVGTRVAQFRSESALEVYGTEGTLVTPQTGLQSSTHGTLLGARAGEDTLRELPIPARLEPLRGQRGPVMFRLLVRDFLHGIDTGTSPSPNFHDGYRVQEIVDAIRQSSATRREVEIPPL